MLYSVEVKEAAKRLYLRRCKPKEIQAQLKLPNIRIVYYWIAKGGWDEMLSDEEPLTAVSRRLTLILEKQTTLSKGELDELDRLTTVRDRLLKQAEQSWQPGARTVQAPVARTRVSLAETGSLGNAVSDSEGGAKKREKKVPRTTSVRPDRSRLPR
jgi:hypothetical protein